MVRSFNKVFWNTVCIRADTSEYSIYLDDQLLKTPKNTIIKLPTEKLASLVANEWEEQAGEISYNSMPVNRLVNAALDKIENQVHEVINLLGEYADTDLLYYRAEKPKELIDEQILVWDPYISWAENAFSIKLNVTNGIAPVKQPQKSMELLISQMAKMSIFKLTVFHKLVTISGSYILGLAAIENVKTTENIWNAAILDENWQASMWGEDQEQKRNIGLKKVEFVKAIDVLKSLS